jgi:hypothetical protein
MYTCSSKKKPVDHLLVYNETNRLTGDDLYMASLKKADILILA